MAESSQDKDTLKKAGGPEKIDIQQKLQLNQATYGHFVVPDFAPPTPPEGAVKYVTPPPTPRPDKNEKDKSKKDKDKDKPDKDKDKSKKDKPPKPEKEKTEKDKDKPPKAEKDKQEKDKDKAPKPEKGEKGEKEKSEKWSLMRKPTMVKVAPTQEEAPPIFVPVNIVEAKPPPRPTRPPTAPPIAAVTRSTDETQPENSPKDDSLPILPVVPEGEPLIPDSSSVASTDESLPGLPAVPPGDPLIPADGTPNIPTEFNETMYAHLSAYSRGRHGSSRNLGEGPGTPRSPRMFEELKGLPDSDSASESTSEKPLPVDPLPQAPKHPIGTMALGEALAWIASYGEPQPEIIAVPYLERAERDSKGPESEPEPKTTQPEEGKLSPAASRKADSRKSGKRDGSKKVRHSKDDKDKKDDLRKSEDKKTKKKETEDPQNSTVEEGGSGTKRSRKEKSRAVVLDKIVLEEVLPGDAK